VFTPEEKDGGEDLGFVRFAELGKPKPREFVVSTLMPARHITMLFGAGGVTKSYIALLIAVSIASGRREIFGYPIERHGEVVYADFELDVDEQHNRVEEVCCGLGIRVPRNLQYISGVEMGSVEAFKRLHALTKRERIELVVIDSLAYAVAGTGYSVIAEDVLEFYNKYTNPLRANGATPLVVHHRPYLLDKPYGSVYNVNNSRFVLEVEKKPKDQDGDGMLLRFRPHKKNLGAEGVVFGQRVKFRDDRVTFEDWTPPEDEGDAETGGRVTAADKIKATMTDGPKTKPEIHKLTAIPLPTINNNLSAMGKTGEVIKLDQKVDGYALFALPGGPHERPVTEAVVDDVLADDEDKDVLEGPRAEVYLLPTPLVSGKSVNEEPPARRLITSDEHLEELVGSLAEADTVAIDVETGPREKGLDPVRCTPGVLSISTTVMTAVVQLTKISDDVVKDLLYSLSEKTLLGHNLKFDLRVLRHRYGYEHEGSTQDTYILKRMIHFADGDRRPEDGKLKVPESVPRAKLGELVEDYLVEELPKTEQVSDWLTEELSDEQVEYARRDTAVLRRLWDAMLVDYRRIIRETSKALGEEIDQDAALDLEGKFLPALVWMESNGFAINTDKWQALADEYTKVVADAEAQMLEIVEAPKYGFNLNSDAQMLTILEALDADLSKLSKTKKTGRPSLAGDSIKKVKGSKTVERFVELHQKRKAAAKYASTYGLKWIKTPEELPELGYTKTQIPDHQMVIDGRVRSNFKQIVRTGRLGSGSPNLQNMPSATKSDHRAALEAPEGRCLSIADYRQIELVVAAIVGNDEEMLAALKDPDRDLHTEMAEDLGKDRGAVKAVNFGRLYLRGAKSISKKDDIPLKEAQELVTAYDERWKDTKAWHYREAEKTTRGDRVVTEAGRVRKISLSPSYKDRLNVYLPEWINHRVQGTVGDGMKLALTRIYQARHEILGNVLLVDAIHDETVVEVDVAQRKAAGKRIEEIMVSAMREVLGVPDAPVRVKTEVAYDYSAAKEVEDE